MNEPNRFLFSYEVYDNKTKKKIAYNSGNCAELSYLKKVFDEAKESVERFELREMGLCPECGTELEDKIDSFECPGCGYTEA